MTGQDRRTEKDTFQMYKASPKFKVAALGMRGAEQEN